MRMYCDVNDEKAIKLKYLSVFQMFGELTRNRAGGVSNAKYNHKYNHTYNWFVWRNNRLLQHSLTNNLRGKVSITKETHTQSQVNVCVYVCVCLCTFTQLWIHLIWAPLPPYLPKTRKINQWNQILFLKCSSVSPIIDILKPFILPLCICLLFFASKPQPLQLSDNILTFAAWQHEK